MYQGVIRKRDSTGGFTTAQHPVLLSKAMEQKTALRGQEKGVLHPQRLLTGAPLTALPERKTVPQTQISLPPITKKILKLTPGVCPMGGGPRDDPSVTRAPFLRHAAHLPSNSPPLCPPNKETCNYQQKGATAACISRTWLLSHKPPPLPTKAPLG